MKLIILERGVLATSGTPPDPRHDLAPDFSSATLSCLADLAHGGFHLALATHQPAVARGLQEMTAVSAHYRRLSRQVEAAGGRIEAVAICSHAADADCSCRMPKPGMLLDLIARFDTPAGNAVLLASNRAAVDAGLAAGCQTWWIGGGGQDDPVAAGVQFACDLQTAVPRLVATRAVRSTTSE